MTYTPLDPTQLSNVKTPVDPSGAASRDGKVVAMVGNVYLAVSRDSGATFSYFDPSTMFPTFAGGIVGDQQIIYILEFNLFVWIMLHNPDPTTSDGAFRLAIAKSDDVMNKPKTAWQYVDFVSSDFDQPGAFLDQPHLSCSQRFLIIAVDAGKGRSDPYPVDRRGQRIDRVAVDRAPHRGRERLSVQRTRRRRCAGNLMAGHIDTSNLRVVEWRDSSSSYNTYDVAVAKWSDSDDYSCTSPSGIDWSSRCGSRVSGVTWRDGHVWFSWMSPRSEDGDSPNYPQPYTRVVDIDAGSFTTASEMQVWNDKYVFAYSALAVNSNSEVAIAVAWGVPEEEADAAFGILGDFVVWYRDGSTATTPGTTPGRWGDFLRTHRSVSNAGHLDGFGYFTNSDAGGNIVQNPYHVRYGR